jgi:hypothetical protein
VSGQFWIGTAIVGAVAYFGFSAYPTAEESVALPRDEVVHLITGQPRTVVGTGFGSLQIRNAGVTDTAVNFSISRNGDPQSITCVVRVEADGETDTAIEPDCSGAAAGRGPQAKLAARMMTVILREHVLAAAEQRPYDTATVSSRIRAMMMR